MHQGNKLRKYLKSSDLSITDFCKKIGRSRTQVYKYFQTEHFEDETLTLINDVLGEEWMSVTVDKTIKGTGRYKHTPRNKGVPVYDVELTASAVESMENYTALEPEYYLDIPFFRDCDFAGKVVGDSMYPKYRHGSIIVCKRITAWQKFFEAGRAYLVITRTDNFRTVKYLQEDDTDNDYLWLLSHNAESFPPQRIPKDEILELYLVKGQIDQ
jgi:transcriptional regulator with XRE-family HTH domain